MMRASTRDETRHHEAGFSLVEMLVALAIGALLIAAVPGMLRLGHRALNAPDDVDRLALRDAGLAFVEQRLAEALPVIERRQEGLIGIGFSGGHDALEFVAPSRTGHRGSGVYRFRLRNDVAMRGNEQTHELILEHALYRPGMPPNHSDWTATRRVLVAAERPARFRYFGAVSDDAPRQWHAQWTRTDRLPELVELRSVSSGVAMEGERTVVAAPMRR